MTTAAAAAPRDPCDGAVEWPILDRVKKVYVDAGLIAAVVMGPSDPFYEIVVRFFRAAGRASVKMFVSCLAIMEVLDVVRKRTKMRRRCRDESEEEREAADAAAAAAADDVVAFIDEGIALKLIVILEDVADVSVDFRRLLAKTLEHPGLTPVARRGDTYRHKGVGPVDLIHTDQAHLAKLPAMGTTDAAMVQLRDDALYGGIEIIVLRPESDADEERQGGGGGGPYPAALAPPI